MQGMTPSAHKRHQMEMERRAREARELREQTRLKRAAAKHVMALWNAALAAGWRTIFYPSVARRSLPAAIGSTLSVRRASRWARQTCARSTSTPTPQWHRGARHVVQALLAASAVRPAARCDETVLVHR